MRPPPTTRSTTGTWKPVLYTKPHGDSSAVHPQPPLPLLRRISPGLCLAAGWATGLVVGLTVGVYLVVRNPIPDVGSRIALILMSALGYSLVLCIAIAIVIAFLSPALRRCPVGAQAACLTSDWFFGLGIAAAGTVVCTRRLALTVGTLPAAHKGSWILSGLFTYACLIAATLGRSDAGRHPLPSQPGNCPHGRLGPRRRDPRKG